MSDEVREPVQGDGWAVGSLDGIGDGYGFRKVRRELGVTAFGVNAIVIPQGYQTGRHYHQQQEELYIVVSGAATFEIDGESVEAPTGALVNVQPAAKRKATATEDGTTILVVGGTPGKPYEPAPQEAADAFAAYNAGDYEEALAKQLVVVEKQPENPIAHFNAGCFAARAGQADQAIEHLGRGVEINERIKKLMATDEDLDSIREDQRFVELAK